MSAPSDSRARPSTSRRAMAVMVAGLMSLTCQRVPGGETPEAEDRPFVASAPADGPALVFPPPPEAKPRGPSPRELTAEVTPEDDVEWPYLDEDGTFSFAGRSLSVSFARRVQIPEKAEGSLVIDPPVKGKTEWNSEWSVRFEADDHFDPDQTYTLTLADLKDEDGKPIAEGWTAKFKARPLIAIAGKVIDYFPDPKRPKVVTVRPWDNTRVGRQAVIRALFDQKVDPKLIAPRVTMFVDGIEVDPIVEHPAEGRYEGVEVEAEHIIRIRPPKKPSPGASIKVGIEAGTPGDSPTELSWVVAEPLKMTDAGCGWGSDSSCKLKLGEMPLPDRNFTLSFNNPIDMDEKQLARAIKITPTVRNLSIWSDRWSEDGRIHVSGDFAHSKTYRVTVGTLKDKFGDKLGRTASFDVVRPSQTASVSMAEGVQFVGAKDSKTFEISTRNVAKAKLVAWEVAPTAKDHAEAQAKLSSREKPSRTPDVVIPIEPKKRRDTSVTTKLNLLDHLEAGKTYLAMLELDRAAFGASKPTYPSWSLAARPATALVTPHDESAIVMHAHASGDETMVVVTRLSSGKPLSGATVTVDDDATTAVTTDADGMAIVNAVPKAGAGMVLSAEHKGDVAQLAMGNRSLTAGHFAPELTGGTAAQSKVRALIVTDRGAYRPGATVRIKAALRERTGGKLAPMKRESVEIAVLDPTGTEVHSHTGTTDELGSIATDYDVSARAAVGRYRIQVTRAESNDVWAEQTVQIAEFEAPRFSVDVDVEREADKKIAAKIRGKYLFGAAMDGAPVSWTLRRSDAPIRDGSFARRGLSFRQYRSWYEREQDGTWTRTGTGELSGSGEMNLRQMVELPDDRGPQRYVLEAEVSDASHRTIAGRGDVVLHPADHYAGIKVGDHWLTPGDPIPLEVGVIDHDGNAVSGKTIEVKLERERWVHTRKSGPGGSYRSDWHIELEPVGSCTTKSAGTVSSCDLETTKSGDYRVTAYVDGKPGGSDYLWAWGYGWDSPSPSKGRTLQVSLDKTEYKPGDKAKLIVASPFEKATAIVTVEDGGMLDKHIEQIEGRAAKFDVTLPRSADGPWVHATVTLLPRDAKGATRADWKLGAVRIPLELDDVALEVAAKSDHDAYEPGQHVELDLDVTRNGKPVANADVVLAVVDEGVLRLTNHHAPDPVTAMHPGQPLSMWVDDNRRAFADLLARSHTGGDGPGSGAQSLVGARKKFVRTALWKPGLRTDGSGHIDVGFDLPDNLTRFRIMAVALDAEGRGGKVEDGFVVRKPLMAQPAVPRFAVVGDSFDAAVMVHNNTDSEEDVTIALGKRTKKVTIAPNSRARAAFTIAPTQAGTRTLVFSIKDSEGTERDKVVAKVPVQAPGLSESPRLSGAFVGGQKVRLQVPKNVSAGTDGDEFVTVTLGEQTWPELAGRLEYLVDYPHGCVEQTTSSTVPLLAAREILPRMGVTRFSKEQIDKMIKVGVDRLDSMRTASGGLAYWPGGHEPNLYGTAYAMNAVVGAKRAGVKLPAGLLEGMSAYLLEHVQADHLPWGTGPEVRASVARSLAEADGLPATAADMLFDTHDKQGPFGTAALAIALSSLDGEKGRVGDLLDQLETNFDDDGVMLTEPQDNEFHYYGSETRSRALAAIALQRLRPSSKKLPGLVRRLLAAPEGYTTQSTAFALLALAEHISAKEDLAAEGRVRALIDGVPVEALLGEAEPLGPGAMQYKIPLQRLAGHEVELQLEAESELAVGFSIGARWHRPLDDPGSRVATTGTHAPDVWRVVTDVDGNEIDLSKIEPGSTLRVVLLARLPHGRVDDDRMGYLALTDRLPAGFEALQPDLWTVASVPQLAETHPLYSVMRWGSEASHVELRDDRALFYYDRVWGDYVHATYLMRATTPGTFSAAPASAELMYETDGIGHTEGLVYGVKR